MFSFGYEGSEVGVRLHVQVSKAAEVLDVVLVKMECAVGPLVCPLQISLSLAVILPSTIATGPTAFEPFAPISTTPIHGSFPLRQVLAMIRTRRPERWSSTARR